MTHPRPPLLYLLLFLLALLAPQALKAQPATPPFTEAERTRIMDRYKQFLERTNKKQAELNAATEQDRELFLANGDMSPIDRAFANKDIKLLWYYYGESYLHSIGVGVIHARYAGVKDQGVNDQGISAAVQEVLRLNKAILNHTREKLAQIPGHAKYLGDQVETMSQEPGYFDARTGNIFALGGLGSMEAIQQLGRFLYDRRAPEGDFFDPETGGTNPTSNRWVSASMMHKALGKESPIKEKIHNNTGLHKLEQLKAIQLWWESDASKPYREWTYETGEPMPPPRPRTAAAASTTAQSPPVNVHSPRQDVNGQDRSFPAWMFGAVLVAAVAIIIAFFLRAKRNNARHKKAL